MALPGESQLLFYIFRQQKINTDQQQDNIRLSQIISDFIIPIIAGQNLAVGPGLNQTCILKLPKILAKLFAARLILMGIRYKQLEPPLALHGNINSDQVCRGKSQSQPLALAKGWPRITTWINGKLYIAFNAIHNKFYAHQS
jgi:hypothetical protein